MPTFEDVEVELTQKIDIDFEVYCGTCGAGLCNESDTRRSRGRNYLQVTVKACPKCMEEKDEIINSLESDKNDLEEKINLLEEKLNNLSK